MPARGFPAKGRFPSGCGPHMCGPYILLKVEVNFMWFWWFMLLCDMLVPIVMVIVGRMMWKHCPKHINSLVGYRTTRSMKIWTLGNLPTTTAENLVESRMGNDYSIRFDTYSVIP